MLWRNAIGINTLPVESRLSGYYSDHRNCNWNYLYGKRDNRFSSRITKQKSTQKVLQELLTRNEVRISKNNYRQVNIVFNHSMKINWTRNIVLAMLTFSSPSPILELLCSPVLPYFSSFFFLRWPSLKFVGPFHSFIHQWIHFVIVVVNYFFVFLFHLVNPIGWINHLIKISFYVGIKWPSFCIKNW